MPNHLFNGHKVNKAFINFVTDKEVKCKTVEQLALLVKREPSMLWRVPACGESVRRRVLELIVPYINVN